MAVSELQAHLGYWLRLVSNNVSQSFARKLEQTGVTAAEWVVLREMHRTHDTTSPGAVAELTGLTKGAVSKLISRLLEKGLVSRRESSDDRRYQDIKLTARGSAIVPRLAKLADQNDEEFFSPLSRTDRKSLEAILRSLAETHQMTNAPIE